VHLWIVGALALLWNSFGAFDYTATQLELPFWVAQFTPELRAYLDAAPWWATATWAIGVWGAFVGSLGLLLARRWAVWMFAASLAALAVNTLYNFVIAKAGSALGDAAVPMTVFIWVVAVALLAYAWRQKQRGVLR
jgi:hypothetical protein